MRWLFLLPAFLFAKPNAVYLSWCGDPTTSIAIHWLTPPVDPHFNPEDTNETLLFGASDSWFETTSTTTTLEQTVIHKTTLENLTPDTLYSFSIGSDPTLYHFRTAPASLSRTVRFLVSGDVYANMKLFRRMSKTAMENDPDFAILGADLSHTLSLHSTPLKRWTTFLSDWQHYMSQDNRLIPFLIVPSDIASNSLLQNLFASNVKQLYRSLDFGTYFSLILLDTTTDISGDQTTWLEDTLSTHTATHRLAIYHEAAYPSFCPHDTSLITQIRTHWVPLFEKYNLPTVFENQPNAFKRTHPLKQGQIDPSGVTYISDGGWGAIPRKSNTPWYLAKRSPKNALLLVELTPSTLNLKALDIQNHPLDIYSTPAQ